MTDRTDGSPRHRVSTNGGGRGSGVASSYVPPASAAAVIEVSVTNPTNDADDADNDDVATDSTLSLASPLLAHHGQPPAKRDERRRKRHEAVGFTWLHRGASAPSQCSLVLLGKQGVIVLLCVINLLNYVDRGIIPGSPEKFQSFISRTLHVEPTRQSFFLGLLASSFIASYSVCAMVFGYWATKCRPFRMIAFGMSVWVVAVACCGLAHALDSYYFLMFGRVLSGVGEASFQCNATPFINMHAPKHNRTLWMGMYLASITVGTAMGYIYSSVVAASSLTWAGAFYLEALVMVALIMACLYCVPEQLDTVPGEDNVFEAPDALVEAMLHHDKHKPAACANDKLSTPQPRVPIAAGFFAGWWEIFRDPVFTLVVLGHASYTFSLAALSVFSPVILIGLGMYEKETQVATAFGGLIVVTGTFGTPIGGILLDKLTRQRGIAASSDQRAYTSVQIIFWLLAAAFVMALAMMAFTRSRVAFLSIMAVCFFFLCALSPAETIAVMELFPESRHAMAIAANTLVIHVLGDVPSPIILGWLKDTWAPHCGTIEIHGRPVLNPDCHLDHEGLKRVLLFPILWLIWGVLLWGTATMVMRHRLRSTSANAL